MHKILLGIHLRIRHLSQYRCDTGITKIVGGQPCPIQMEMNLNHSGGLVYNCRMSYLSGILELIKSTSLNIQKVTCFPVSIGSLSLKQLYTAKVLLFLLYDLCQDYFNHVD